MKKKVRCKNCGSLYTLKDVRFGVYYVDFLCPVCKMYNCYNLIIKKPQWLKELDKKNKERNKLCIEQYKIFNKLKEETGMTKAEMLLGNH